LGHARRRPLASASDLFSARQALICSISAFCFQDFVLPVRFQLSAFRISAFLIAAFDLFDFCFLLSRFLFCLFDFSFLLSEFLLFL